MIDRIPWSEQTQYSLLSSFDLAVAPLVDEPYTRGKCGYKLLQYAAAGLPIVGSPVGVNEKLLADIGLPAATDDSEWVAAILELLAAGASVRERLGRRGCELIEREYSYDAWLPQWLEAIGVGHRTAATRQDRVSA
jgi:glycosyltransferase involved in cell wall biosynthesis